MSSVNCVQSAFLVVGKGSVGFVVVCSHVVCLIVVIIGKWSDDSAC